MSVGTSLKMPIHLKPGDEIEESRPNLICELKKGGSSDLKISSIDIKCITAVECSNSFVINLPTSLENGGVKFLP